MIDICGVQETGDPALGGCLPSELVDCGGLKEEGKDSVVYSFRIVG